jgi:hypothetical protein
VSRGIIVPHHAVSARGEDLAVTNKDSAKRPASFIDDTRLTHQLYRLAHIVSILIGNLRNCFTVAFGLALRLASERLVHAEISAPGPGGRAGKQKAPPLTTLIFESIEFNTSSPRVEEKSIHPCR